MVRWYGLRWLVGAAITLLALLDAAQAAELVTPTGALLVSDYGLVNYMYQKVNELMGTPSFREKLAYALTCQCVPLLETQNQRLEFLRNLEQLRTATDKRDMDYYFHSHPNHSVGHLHMHCINKNMLTKAFELNSHKNVPIEMVLQRILSMA